MIIIMLYLILREKEMSNFTMTVSISGELIRCETQGNFISLSDLVSAGNKHRIISGLPARNLFDIRSTQSYKDFKKATAERLRVAEEDLEKTTKGRNGRTMGHLYLAVYVAEQLSPQFHVDVIAEFVNGRILEFREAGGIEYKQLAIELDRHMQVWEKRDAHKGHYIALANIIKDKLLPADVSWSSASASQTRARYDVEDKLTTMLRCGVVRDWGHLKELAGKV